MNKIKFDIKPLLFLPLCCRYLPSQNFVLGMQSIDVRCKNEVFAQTSFFTKNKVKYRCKSCSTFMRTGTSSFQIQAEPYKAKAKVSFRSNKKARKDILIRQLSEKSQNLHFLKNELVKKNEVCAKISFLQRTYPRYVQKTKFFATTSFSMRGFCMKQCFAFRKKSFRQSQKKVATLLSSYKSPRFFDIKETKLLQRRKRSIFSFDLKCNQLLFANNHFYQLNFNRKLSYLYSTNLDKMSFLSSDLSNLALSLKTYTLLKQKGINKIGNLVAYSPQLLFQLLNRNKEMFAEVKRCFLVIAVCENI